MVVQVSNLMQKYKRNQLEKLVCPNCGNDKIYVKINFRKSKKKERGIGICIKRIYKSSIARKFGKPKIIGCGKNFVLKFKNKP